MGTAHDCLEHFPGDDGTIDREFMALGCMNWIRVEQGYFRGDAASSIGTEMAMTLWRLYYYDEVSMRDPEKKIKHSEVFDSAIEYFQNEVEDDFDDIEPEKMERFKKSALYWLEVGYRKAKKRYPNPGKVCYIFQQIEEKVNKVLKYAEENQEFEISYKISTCEVFVEEIYQQDEDY